jgi:hypothetical protein
MKKLRCCFVSTLFLAWLLLMGAAYADTDLLNLSAYSEGAALPYGENVVVGQDEKTAVKWVTTGAEKAEGKMKFPVSLSGDFDLVIKSNILNSTSKTLFLTADEYQIKLTFGRYTFQAPSLSSGKDTANDESKAYKEDVTNVMKLSVKGSVAKLYVNDVFSLKLTLKPNLTYTQLLFNGLYDKDQLFELSLTGNGSGGSTQPPVSGGNDFEAGKQAGIQAGIQQCVANPSACGITVTTCSSSGSATSGEHASYNPSTGELHIPLIDVPGAFGGMQTYEVYLKQQPLKFTFDLDMGRVVLK